MTPAIDLNSDLGESFGSWRLGDDEAMFALVTSANVACGFHAGDPVTMRRSVELAVRHGVALGAHPGYRDLAGFGRRAMDASPAELAAELLYQIGALDGIARAHGTRVRYVKAHGALYHRLGSDAGAARAFAEALAAYSRTTREAVGGADAEADTTADADPGIDATERRTPGRGLVLLGAPRTELEHAAGAAGLRFAREAFADRGYAADGTLLPRGTAGAVITDADAVAERAVELATTGGVRLPGGGFLELRPDSICLHGDTPGAVALASRVRAALAEAGVAVRAFADGTSP
ncbi:LamB/YcsF family protein [Agromyces soli]